MGMHEHTMDKSQRRFLKDRIEGLLMRCALGAPRTISDNQLTAVIERTLQSNPKDATHWSIRSMATVDRLFTDSDPRIWEACSITLGI
jgi:hypothetical protein